jgi:hypothetical protein
MSTEANGEGTGESLVGMDGGGQARRDSNWSGGRSLPKQWLKVYRG